MTQMTVTTKQKHRLKDSQAQRTDQGRGFAKEEGLIGSLGLVDANYDA